MNKASVLVVDDTPANIDILVGILGDSYALKVAIDGPRALAIARKSSPDIILLDVMMPGMSGYEVCELLKQDPMTAHIPVIFVTALSEVTDETKGFELGAVDYITKPVSAPLVQARVRTHLALYDQKRLLEQQVKERTAELERTRFEIIRRQGRAAEYKDNETGNHILRIGETAALMASALGCAPRWVELLRLAAPMHDVGKIGIPDSILLKPGPLTAAERELMNRHARIGHDILRDQTRSPLLDMAAEVALNHHERWDGGGYPNSLQGEAIPLSARIVTLCDVYDALRSKRPYKEAWPVERARAHIQEQAGKQFDPKLVALLESLYDEIEALREGLTDPSMAGEGACAASQQPVLSNR